MTTTELEVRVLNLEKELALLKKKIEKDGVKEKDTRPWWEQIAGTFADDPAYDEAMRLGREYRLSQQINYDEDEE